MVSGLSCSLLVLTSIPLGNVRSSAKELVIRAPRQEGRTELPSFIDLGGLFNENKMNRKHGTKQRRQMHKAYRLSGYPLAEPQGYINFPYYTGAVASEPLRVNAGVNPHRRVPPEHGLAFD